MQLWQNVLQNLWKTYDWQIGDWQIAIWCWSFFIHYYLDYHAEQTLALLLSLYTFSLNCRTLYWTHLFLHFLQTFPHETLNATEILSSLKVLYLCLPCHRLVSICRDVYKWQEILRLGQYTVSYTYIYSHIELGPEMNIFPYALIPICECTLSFVSA